MMMIRIHVKLESIYNMQCNFYLVVNNGEAHWNQSNMIKKHDTCNYILLTETSHNSNSLHKKNDQSDINNNIDQSEQTCTWRAISHQIRLLDRNYLLYHLNWVESTIQLKWSFSPKDKMSDQH